MAGLVPIPVGEKTILLLGNTCYLEWSIVWTTCGIWLLNNGAALAAPDLVRWSPK